ncbi:DUF4091 domain-containing protein [Horticoccus luteus]|uniref:DUF4091 domain-containing protein n=1 Tax=Horticoccus luteus TaxID=2862869 RepID=A0A8F9TVA8_9BACT|nr:glycoside hydrolase domain-containing protein [Horticoccus luteus]QYM78770.1 DUF4091 domain-containing protein [Horticoccus luteus]
MKSIRGVWLGAGLLALSAGAADFPRARHFTPEAVELRVRGADFGNVLRDAKVTASSYDTEQRPEYVVDGKHDDAVLHWGAKKLPAWVALEMPEARRIAELRLWMLAGGVRRQTFFIEGSSDGATWTTLVDRRENQEPATPAGFRFVLPQPVKVRWVRLTVVSNSKADDGAMVHEIAAYAAPDDGRIAGAVGDLGTRYDGNSLPGPAAPTAWRATGWRGERVHGQFVVWSSPERRGLRAEVSALRTAGGAKLDPRAARVRVVRPVLADGAAAGDVLDAAERVDLPAGTLRAWWLTVAVPRDATPGVYRGELTVRADGAEPRVFPLELDVLVATLPEPRAWAFHLDVWQHPWAIARWHDVAPWSEAHFRLMRPYLVELAQAGQKVITTTITPRPWGRRDYDDYGTMVQHIRRADGSWRFDYEVFDHYVKFAMACGITQQIHCYSLLTWGGQFAYTDEVTGDERAWATEPGEAAYADYWGPFLADFEKHLAAKGWLERTRIAVDEAPAPMMKAMMDVLRTHAPRLRVALAGNQAPSHYTGLEVADFSIILNHVNDELVRDLAARRAAGRTTTFYICLDPPRPNTFVTSPPAEAVWLGYSAAANGFDGLLRWAYTTWPENPLRDTSYWGHPHIRYLPAGDTFLMYPGPRSSIRWELLRDGIEEAEKLRLLRARGGGKLPAAVAAELAGFADPQKLGDGAAVAAQVEAMRAAVNAAARAGGIRP